jgi:hypothetical protein
MPMNPRLLKPLAGGFNPLLPLSISGLQLWLDSSETSTLTLNGSAPSQTVSEWRDRRSGSNRLASQGNAGNQPDYRPTGINNKPTVFFKASSWMDTSGTNFALTQPCSYFVVFRMPSSAASNTVFDTASGARQICQANAGTNVTSIWAGTGFVNTSTGRSVSEVIAKAVIVNGASSQAAVKSRTLTTLASTPGANNSPTHFKIGAFTNNTASLDGDIAELHVYSGALSAQNVRALMEYARSKWGVTIA